MTAMTRNSGERWFAVRCVYRLAPAVPTGKARGSYEERVTLWLASSIEDAITHAEVDALGYAKDVGASYLRLAQAYELEGLPGDGAEVYSLIRESSLDTGAYLDTFFDTGQERSR